MPMFFTKPAVSSVTRSRGAETASWPCEARNLAELLTKPLPVSLLGELGVSGFSEEHSADSAAYSQESKHYESIKVETQIHENLKPLWEAVHLALETCSQCHQLRGLESSNEANTFIFSGFLHEALSILMPAYSLQEQVDMAAPRGQSATLNFLPGLSAISHRAPFVALYDIQNFEKVFSQSTGYSSGSSVERNLNASKASFNGTRHSEPESTHVSNVRDIRSNATSSEYCSPSESPGRYEDDSDKSDTTERSSPSPSSDSSMSVRGESLAYPTGSNPQQAAESGSASEERPNGVPGGHDDNIQQTQQLNQELPSESAKDAYLLSEACIGSSPSVALLCAGSIDQLEMLMLSSMYHRSTWGIVEPLIGFTWDSAGMIISIVFGWIDPNSAEDGSLPNAHIAYVVDTPEKGVFDLTNPASLLRLVIFLWNIREDLDRIVVKLETAVPHMVQLIQEHGLMQWRADTTSRLLNEGHLSSRELISLWQGWEQPIQDDVSLISQLGTLSEKNTRDCQHFAKYKSSSERGTPSLARHWERSRSYFEDYYQRLTTPIEEMWLQDRRAYSIPLSSHDGAPGSDMLGLFNRFTQLYNLPHDMKAPIDFSSDPKLRDLLEELQSCNQDCAHDRKLDNTVWKHLMPHMDTIFKLSASAQKKMRYKSKHQLVQSETLTEWGCLLTMLFHGSRDRNYCLRIINKKVDLPRNVASELVPFIYADPRTCSTKFRGFSSFIYTQMLDWTNYRIALTNANAPSEHVNQVRRRLWMLGSRMMLFQIEENKRHLLRAVQRDPTRNRTNSLGVLTIETIQLSNGTLRADTSCCDGSPLQNDLCLPRSVLRTTQLELGILYYGYPGKTGHHPRQIPQTAMNHVRMSLVAGVTHLASLGIVEFPLFGVAIEGSVGTIICAWCGPLKVLENIESCIYVFDKDTVQYDLATPIGAYNYATFVSLLATKHAPELATRIKNRWTGESEVSEKNWSASGWIRDDWTMAEQVAWFEEHGYLDYFDCYSV